MRQRVATAPLPSQVLLYPYNSRDWFQVERGDLRDGSCRPDPDFVTMTLGLCRPPLRALLHRQWQAGHLQGGLDFAFFTRTRRGPDVALVAWLTLVNIFSSHAAAVSAGCTPSLNLMRRGSTCLNGTTYRGRSLPRSTRCGCVLYAQRIQTPYLILEATRPNAIRLTAPLGLSFARLQLLLSGYLTSKWPAGVPEFGTFMQAGQGWGHRITDAADIRRLSTAFEGAPASLGPAAPRWQRTARSETRCRTVSAQRLPSRKRTPCGG